MPLPCRLKQYIVNSDGGNGAPNGDHNGEADKDDEEVSKTGDDMAGESEKARAESPDSVKMNSSSEAEVDSAMSQVQCVRCMYVMFNVHRAMQCHTLTQCQFLLKKEP